MDNKQGSFFSPAPPQPMTKKSVRVSRGKKLKRHPSRAQAVKRVVATKPVKLQYLPNGPIGKIIESTTQEGQRLVRVKWEGKEKATLHNPRFLISVESNQGELIE